jgi:hypothetical protein
VIGQTARGSSGHGTIVKNIPLSENAIVVQFKPPASHGAEGNAAAGFVPSLNM